MNAKRRTLLVFLLATLPLSAQVPTGITCPTGLLAGGPAGLATVTENTCAAKGPTTLGVACPAITATFTSSNPGVATVPASQIVPGSATLFTFPVTPVSAGMSTITVTVLGNSQQCTVTVAAAAVGAVNGPTLSPAGILLMAALLLAVGTIVLRRW